jgi:DNA invertase Pin-like site-specific DNA recombinase
VAVGRRGTNHEIHPETAVLRRVRSVPDLDTFRLEESPSVAPRVVVPASQPGETEIDRGGTAPVSELYDATYSRVSTDRQEVRTQSDRLASAAPGARPFVDDGISGAGVVRPAFDALCSEVRAGRIRSVTVTKLDRLGRSARRILEFFEDAEARQVRVVVLDLGLDTSTPLGRFARTMAAGYAELERDLIAERTRDAMAALKSGARRTKSGRPVGRPQLYDAEFARRVVQLRDSLGPNGERKRWSQIAMSLHAPAGSLRKLYSTHRHETPRAINSSADLEHREGPGAQTESK